VSISNISYKSQMYMWQYFLAEERKNNRQWCKCCVHFVSLKLVLSSLAIFLLMQTTAIVVKYTSDKKKQKKTFMIHETNDKHNSLQILSIGKGVNFLAA
jgi:hypothetical protein